MSRTVAIIGGTGKTGKWAVKAALVRGHRVRLLARSPSKAKALLKELFPEEDKESQVAMVEGSISDADKLAELFSGADVIMSFLGMVKPPEWVVRPGVEAIMTAMKSMESPPKFLCMSSIALGDSLAQGRKAWGRMTTWLCLKVALKSVFADMQAAEDYILENRGDLNVTIARATILKDKKGYLKDYASDGKSYKFVRVDEKAKLSFQIDRQHVAEAFLDLCDKTEYDNQCVSIFSA